MTLTRRGLEDLWEAGKEYDLSPDSDGSAMVYLRKLGPTQQGHAVRMANAERAKTLLTAKDTESEQHIALKAEVEEMDRDELVEKLAQTKVQEQRQKVEQELTEEDEWGKDDYLQNLVDSWENGLFADWAKGEGARSEESEKVFAEIQRFSDTVGKKLEAELKMARREIEEHSMERLVELTMEAQVEYEASVAWMRVFRLHQIMYGLHTVDRERMFESLTEVESLPAELFSRIASALTDLVTPTVDVKS